MNQQYRRHVQNALVALDEQHGDTDIARRQIAMAIAAYQRNAQLKGQDVKKPSAPTSEEGFNEQDYKTILKSNGSNATNRGQAPLIADIQQGITQLNTTQKRVIGLIVATYLLTLTYAVWSNLLLMTDLGYGTDDQWLMVAAEFSQSLFMIAGLHWWLGARGHEFPIAFGIALFSFWMFADRLVVAAHYHRAVEQLKGVMS